MDPISQGAVGAAFAQSSTQAERIRAYALFGCLAGMAPDLDIFIQSSSDPLLFLEYHRHFTHALVFIPVGALIVCAVLYKLARHPLSWRQAYLACFIGYATHGFLDACTSYGTQLFWPFSDVRISWNNVSVIDPLATLPLLALVMLSVWKRSRRLAVAGVCWFLGYLLVGLVQHERAMATAYQMAAVKGHTPHRLTTKPGFANLLVWKSIYEYDGHYYIDAIRVGADRRYCPGERIAVFDYDTHLPGLAMDSQQARDIERFRWFSDDYIASMGDGDVVDVRYSAVPNEINPLWWIRVDVDADDAVHADFITNRRTSAAQTQALWMLLTGDGCQPFNHDSSSEGENT